MTEQPNLSKSKKADSPSLKDSWIHMAAGSIGGGIASMIVQPLDVIRTRMQKPQTNLNGKNVHRAPSMYEVGKNVIRNEGPLGLWKGTGPTLWRTVPGAGLYFLFMERLSSFFKNNQNEQLSSVGALVSGSLSRVLVTTALIPVTVVKTRFEAFETKQYRGTFDALKSISSTEGYRSLYSGLVPTILRDVPFSGIYLLFYEKSKNQLSEFGMQGTLANVSAGLIAGTVATVVTHPTDVLKTRLQLPPSHPTEKRSALTIMSKMIREEGISGLYKGFLPRLIRRPMMTAITWAIYEELKITFAK